jgi:hypothetical protein
MIALLRFVLSVLAAPFKSKGRLEAEKAALHHKLVVLRPKAPSAEGRGREAAGIMSMGLVQNSGPVAIQRGILKTQASGMPRLLREASHHESGGQEFEFRWSRHPLPEIQ